MHLKWVDRVFSMTTFLSKGNFPIVLGALFFTQANAETQTEPSKPKDSWLVGAHYYPWYGAPRNENDRGWLRKALRGRLEPRQLPVSGIYDSRDQEVIGTHIEQSIYAGIDFWSVSWWGAGKREDQTLLEHILTHPEAGKLKYAVLYESTGRLGSFDNPDYSNLIPDFTYMKEHLFSNPHYLKIDDKPVVFIYLTRVYFRHQGGETLAALREEFPNLYLIGDDVFGPRYRPEYAKQWDAISAYDIYGQSMQNAGATRKGIERLLINYRNAQEAAHAVGTAFVPGIAPGYNDRAVRSGHPGRPRYFTDEPGSKEGDIFRAMIEEVAKPLSDPKAQRMWTITSFNEWYEDTQIEPTAGDQPATTKDDSDSGEYYTEGDLYPDYGNLYLDILKEALEDSDKE
jgi:glycoprotein endo-alpha-1,2-mannosidase